MRQHRLIGKLAICSLLAIMYLKVGHAEEGMSHGVYLKEISTPPDLKPYEDYVRVITKRCFEEKKKKPIIEGPANFLKGHLTEEYYTADGAVMATYTSGYRFAGDVCKLTFEEYKESSIVDLKNKRRYVHTTDDPNWIELDGPDLSQGKRFLGLLEGVGKQHGVKPEKLGEKIYTEYGVPYLPCTQYRLKDNKWCEWRKTKEHDYPGPVELVLSSEGPLWISKVVRLDFKASFPRAKVQIPKVGTSEKDVLKGVLDDDANSTVMWCRQQKKKTGKNPCEDEDDDE